MGLNKPPQYRPIRKPVVMNGTRHETVSLTLNEFERENEPWPGDETDVDEPGHVAEHPQGDQFDVTDLADDFHAVEVGHHLRHVVDNRSNAKKRR